MSPLEMRDVTANMRVDPWVKPKDKNLYNPLHPESGRR